MARDIFDLTEEMTIAALAVIAVYSIYYIEATDLPQIIAAGLIGYISREKSKSKKDKE